MLTVTAPPIHEALAGRRTPHRSMTTENFGSVATPAPKTTQPLRAIFAANRSKLLLTYFLFNLENLLRLSQPFVLGLAINDLLHESSFGLLLFVGQHLTHLLVSSARQMYDTRVFTGIYTNLATKLVVDQRGREIGLSRVAARSSLSREFVEFFENHVPQQSQHHHTQHEHFHRAEVQCFAVGKFHAPRSDRIVVEIGRAHV